MIIFYNDYILYNIKMNRILVINVIFISLLLLISITTTYNYYILTKIHFSKKKCNEKMIHVDEFDYDIQEIPNFLTDEECDKIIEMSKSELVPSLVYTDNKDLYITENRKSKQCWFDDNKLFIKTLSDKIKNYTNTNNKYHEKLQVVNYEPGGFFIPHYDACDGDTEYCERMNGNNGPRYLTFMVYLNDDFEGGETIFPIINKLVKPKKGKAVLFKNVNDNGNIINQSFHGGEPVKSGEKWIINKWIHIK